MAKISYFRDGVVKDWWKSEVSPIADKTLTLMKNAAIKDCEVAEEITLNHKQSDNLPNNTVYIYGIGNISYYFPTEDGICIGAVKAVYKEADNSITIEKAVIDNKHRQQGIFGAVVEVVEAENSGVAKFKLDITPDTKGIAENIIDGGEVTEKDLERNKKIAEKMGFTVDGNIAVR